MANKDIKIVITADNKTSKGFNSLGRNFDKLSKKMDNFQKKNKDLISSSKKVGLAFGAVAAGIGFLAKEAIQAAATFEQSQIAFTTMLGSAEKAEKLLIDLAEFAKRTPFELTGVEATAKQLLAMGIETDNLLPTLKSLGDVSAGLSIPMERLALNFGQVKAQGKLTGRELRDFAIQGVPLIAELAKQLDVSKEKIGEMVSAGVIGFDEVQLAFQTMSGEGGKFNDLMDKQSKSLNGMISNLKDSWDLFLRGEGQALLDWGKKFVELAISIIENVLPKWIEKIKDLIGFLKDHKEVLIIVAGAIIGVLIPAIASLVVSFGILAIAMAPWLIGGAIVGAIVAGIFWIIKNWDVLKAAAFEAWEGIKIIIKESVDSIIGFFDPLINAINTIIEGFKKIKEATVGVFSNIGTSFKNLPQNLGLQNFDNGGIVQGPKGSSQLIQAHAGETVLPTHKRGVGVGTTININNPVLLDQSMLERMSEQIAVMLRDQLRV